MNTDIAVLLHNWPLFGWALVCAFSLSVLLVITKPLHGRFSLDSSGGIQKLHAYPTPRIGGLAITLALFLAWWFIPQSTSAERETRHLLALLLIGLLPAFLAGFVEDITKQVGVRARLLATAASGLWAALLTGYWVSCVHIPGLDHLLAIPVVGLLFTAFAVAGVANSVNIIDGLNGLASGVVVLMLLTIGVIAFRVGDMPMLYLALLGAAVTFGFLCVNFPRGYLFLGDAGAYTLGFYVSMLCVMLAMRNPLDVSPWAMLLVCGYPVIETLFSVYRRMTRRRKHHPGAPDASHLHSLIYRRILSRRLMPGAPAWQRNAFTSPALWIYAMVPMLGAIFWPSSVALVLAWLAMSVVLYCALYRRVLKRFVFTLTLLTQ